MTRRAAAAVAVVLAAGCGLFGSEERHVVRTLEAAARAASVEGDETAVARMAGAVRVGRYFAEDFEMDGSVETGTLHGRDEVVALAARARSAVAGLQVGVADVDVTLPAPDTATAYLTLTVTGRGTPAGRPGPAREAPEGLLDARELLVTLRRVHGDWLIARVDPVSTLERR